MNDLESHVQMWRPRNVLGLVAVLLLAGCAPVLGPGDQDDEDLHFSETVLPIIQESFLPLLTEDSGLNANSWEGLVRGTDQGEVIIPFDADRSLLIELAERAENGPTEGEIDVVRTWIEAGAPSDTGEIPYADSEQLLYVCNQGSAVISVIDMEANVVIRTIDLRDLGFSDNAKPHHAVVSADGSHWYVSLIGENTVLKFNRDNELVAQASFEVPGMLSLDTTSDRLFVGRSMSAVNPPQRIGLIERKDMSVEEIDVFYPRPHALQVTPDGQYAFSASLGVNQMASIDIESLDVEITEVPGPHHSLVQFALAPDGASMIVGGEMSGELLFFDLDDPMHPSFDRSLQLGGSPWHPTFLPDGSHAFVPRKAADAVSIIDMATRTESAVVFGRGFAQPHGSAVRPDGRYVYVSNNNLDEAYTPRYHESGDPNGSVVVIDTETLEISKVIEVENYPTGIGARPTY